MKAKQILEILGIAIGSLLRIIKFTFVHPCPEQSEVTEPEGVVRILTSAIRHKGEIFTGARHNEIIKQIHHATGDIVTTESEQGFLTTDLNFANRIEAAKIALAAGQIETVGSGKLYSEDVW